jgi:branched-chain amino acid transport system substrate-binding protein
MIMKKFRKAMGLVLASAMLVASLAACGGDDKVKDQNAGSGSSNGEAVLKIGGIGPLTGGNAVYGQAAMNGAQIAIDEINEAGGINGMMIEFNAQDDEADPDKGVNAYNNLKDWGMQILMGCVTSGSCTAVSDYAHEDNLFLLTPSASSLTSITYDNAFRVCFSDPNQGVGAADYISQHQLASKVAIIYDNSDVYSSGITEKFTAEANNIGLEIVASEAFNADNKTDFSVQLQAAKDAGAELVFLPIYYNEASLILSQAAAMEYQPMFFGCDGLDGILGGVENFDLALAEGVMLLTPFAADATDDMTVSFVTKYQEKYGEIPNQFAADSYDAIYIIKAAMEKAGVTAEMSVSEMCDAMKAAMTQITVDGLTGSAITWSEDGEPTKAPKAVVIENGAYKAME